MSEEQNQQQPQEMPAENQQPAQEQQTQSQTGGLAERLLQQPESNAAPNADPWETDAWKGSVRFKTAEGEIDVKGLARAYKEAEKRISSGDIPPKDETGYKIEVAFPEGVEVHPERMQSFLKGAHAKGMTNAQANWVMEQYSGIIQEGMALQQSQKVSAESVLKEQWGNNFDNNMTLAQKAFHAVADDADRAAIAEIGNSVPVLKLLAKLGANLKEDPGLPADISGMGQEDINALMKGEAYWNNNHPEHDKVKRQVTQWFQAQGSKRAA